MLLDRNENMWSLRNLDNFTSGLSQKEVYSVLNANMPLSEYIDIWLSTFKKRRLKPASYQRLVISAKALEAFAISKQPIGEISFFDVQEYVNQLSDRGYGFTTIQKQFRLLTAPMKQAASMKIIPCDPTVGIELPAPVNVKKLKRVNNAYDKEEQARLLTVIQQDGGVGAACIAFMIETGLRPGEALALRWKDVDVGRNRVKVCATVVNLMHKSKAYIQESPKSASSVRIIPLTKRAVQMLMLARSLSDSEWVFENHGDRLSYAALVYQTKKLCRAANIPYRGEHVFRHTFATNCYYKGVDIKILSKILGHSDVKVTYNTYIDLYGDAFADMYNALTS